MEVFRVFLALGLTSFGGPVALLVVHPDPRRDKCEQAEAQLMALALNVCSGRLGPDCCAARDGSPVTVADTMAEADALLSDPARTVAGCTRAQALADAVNTGKALCD